MCWSSAPTIFRASWYKRSSSQWEFKRDNWDTIRLCSRIHNVCMTVSWGCSLQRPSPILKAIHLKIVFLLFVTYYWNLHLQKSSIVVWNDLHIHPGPMEEVRLLHIVSPEDDLVDRVSTIGTRRFQNRKYYCHQWKPLFGSPTGRNR